jgi:tetratricopeptide (TPR) repeat protein
MVEQLKQQTVAIKFDKINATLAAFAFLFSFVIYYLTKAPTFSLWDCGEFVACSHILGIPHPPGFPLYIILGRVFAWLPIDADIAVRVNLLSCITASVAVMFGYLITVRLIRYWYKDQANIYNRIIIYIGGLTGALFMAFSTTHWANSVEAEVYSPTMALMTIIYWLVLKYFEHRETGKATHYLLLVTYLAVLGVGIHLTLYLIMPVAALYFILKKEAGLREWALISAFFVVEMYLIFLLSSKQGEAPFYITILILFISFLFNTILIERKNRPTAITMGIFLVTLYPVYFLIIELVSKNLTGSGLTPFLSELSKLPVGWIGFAGLIVWGLFSLVKYFTLRMESDGNNWLYQSVYSLAPVVLYAVGQMFEGYAAFVIISLILVLSLALVVWKYVNWLILVALGSISMIMLGFWPFIYGLIFGAVAVIILGAVMGDKSWKIGLTIVLLAAIGFSVHMFIPIRSSNSPNIDENDPSRSATAFINYLERKQYGAKSMTEKMFTRRAEWSSQFGDFRRMGFWRFFKDQYGFSNSRFVIVLILGLFGLWELIRRRLIIGLPFMVLILISSVGLILYMNFADGSRINPVTGFDYLEVRNRDYFFTPAYVLFGLAIGLGIAAFIQLIRDTFAASSNGMKKLTFSLSTLMVLLPLFPLANNYFVNDRSKNYLPYDYAYNLLKSCRPDAILFTGGDNDTFPLWCIQETYGVRTDVRVVNLMLANMDWYTKQLRNRLDVPIRWTDEQIERLVPYRDSKGIVHKIQNQVGDHIINSNQWRFPIQYVVSAGESNMRYQGQSLEEYLMLEGLTMNLRPTKDESDVNFDLTEKLYTEEFYYRGINDSAVYLDEASLRLIYNYAQGYLFLADSMRRAEDYDSALTYIDMGLNISPNSEDIYAFTAQMFGEMGRRDTMEIFIENAPIENKARLYHNWAMSTKLAGRDDEALELLELAYQKYPDYVDAYHALANVLYENKYYSRMRLLIKEWVQRHPEDLESVRLLRQIESIDQARDSIEGR